MGDVIEITVVKTDSNDLVIHIFEDEFGLKAICSNDYQVTFITKNSPCEEGELNH